MTMLRNMIQDHPKLLVWAWQISERFLRWGAPLIRRLGMERVSRWFHPLETLFKRVVFDCQDCGQCILHYTGLTCPMTCPKQLRNGPCGGVRLDGKCEVYADRDCVWVKALERIERTPYLKERARLNPPVDWQLQGVSSWVTHALERDQIAVGNDATVRYAEEGMEVSL